MSTSPSGRHLGHYHTQILPQMEGEAEDWTEIFLWIHSTIINLDIENGVILPRWTKVHTIMQPKDVGLPKLHR